MYILSATIEFQSWNMKSQITCSSMDSLGKREIEVESGELKQDKVKIFEMKGWAGLRKTSTNN